jgi:basic membrane protein A and related proteins
MSQRRSFAVVLPLLLVVVLSSCAAPSPATQAPAPTAPPPTAAPAPTEAPPTAAPAPTQAPTTQATEASKDLRIAVVTCCSLESQWDAQFLKALDRVKAEKPHDLNITYQVTDNTFGDDATPVIQNYAESGDYDIVWTTSTYSDQVEKIMDQYPNVQFVVQGSGNRGLGKNQYWTYMRVHEPAYLLGMIAGKMTKTNRVGAVGTFEADDVNDEINAFFQGAKDVNPDVKTTVSFIQSWYDPVKGAEATTAQAAAGVDYMLQLADGWEACTTKNIMCFGNFGDQNALAPKNVPNSTVAQWDPSIQWVIDQWWGHVAEGKPYEGNAEPVWFGMADGGSDIGPWHGFDAQLPKDVLDMVNAKRQEILDGAFKLPPNIETPKSDS